MDSGSSTILSSGRDGIGKAEFSSVEALGIVLHCGGVDAPAAELAAFATRRAPGFWLSVSKF